MVQLTNMLVWHQRCYRWVCIGVSMTYIEYKFIIKKIHRFSYPKSISAGFMNIRQSYNYFLTIMYADKKFKHIKFYNNGFNKFLVRIVKGSACLGLLGRGRAISAPSFRRRRLGAADSALDNSAPCRFGAGHFGAVS